MAPVPVSGKRLGWRKIGRVGTQYRGSFVSERTRMPAVGMHSSAPLMYKLRYNIPRIHP